MLSRKYVNEVLVALYGSIQGSYKYLWLGHVSHYGREVTIGATKSRDDELRGVLLTHLIFYTDYWEDAKELGTGSYIIMKDWNDPVYTALQSINTLPEQDSRFYSGNPQHEFLFELCTFSSKCQTTLFYAGGPIQDKSIATLWKNLRQGIYDIAQVYNHPELTDYVAPMWKE